LNSFFQALKYNQILGDKRSTAISLNSIGELLIKKGDFKEASAYFYQGITIAQQLRLRQELRKMYSNQMITYAAMQKIDSSEKYLSLYNTTLDSTWKNIEDEDFLWNNSNAEKKSKYNNIYLWVAPVAMVFVLLLLLLIFLGKTRIP